MFRMIASVSLFAVSLSGGLQAQEMQNADTMVIMDVSNSMWGQIDGVSKMEIARGVVGDLITDLDTESEFGLIAYGHRQSSSCTDIELVMPVAPLNGEEFANAISEFQPRGRTPLTDAVAMAAEVMNSDTRSARVILLTDGLESCDADPCAVTAELEQNSLDFTVHVIGFGVAAIEDQSEISCIAENTGGLYLTADNAAELTDALMVMSAPVADATPEPTEQPAPIIRVDVEGVSIDGPSKTDAGAEVSALWEGPSNSGDYLAIARNSDPVTTFSDYARTSAGNPAILAAPAEDGVYEIRYISPVTNDILATDLLIVGAIQIDLFAPEQVITDADFAVSWLGPLLDGDALVLTTPGADSSDIIAFGTATQDRTISFTAPSVAGDFEVQYQDLDGNVLKSIPLNVAYTATIDAPVSMIAGADITVGWSGPNLTADRLVIASLDGLDTASTNFGLTSDGAQLKFATPDIPGAYEIRYILGDDDSVIASVPLNLTQPSASISADADALLGADVIITWEGPDHQNDFLTVVPYNAPDGTREAFQFARQGSPMTLQMPEIAGDYEIRYVTGQTSRTLASAKISVAPEPTIIEAAPTAIAGELVAVTWQGPETAEDLITIIQVGNQDDAVGNYTFTSAGSELTVQSEEVPGDYEIRYISGTTQEVLARLPITLLVPPVSVETQESAGAGATISVEWVGPDETDDFITIVPQGAADDADGNYTYTRNGAPLDLITQDVAGDYEIRYISNETKEILARTPIVLTQPNAVLNHDASAVAGAEVSVFWTGPDHTNDLITIVQAGTPNGEFGNHTFTIRGSELTVLSPDIAGEYEIRYVTGQSYQTLASQPLLLEAPVISIDAYPVGTVSTNLTVEWSGPSNQNDFVTVVSFGASEEALGAYQYTRKGNPLELLLPDTAGAYEIRYISGQSMRTLHSLPLTILAQ